jgi:hypothetical protein
VATSEWTHLCDDIHTACCVGGPLNLSALLAVRMAVTGLGGSCDGRAAAAGFDLIHPHLRILCQG